jgi:hypothetical protein
MCLLLCGTRTRCARPSTGRTGSAVPIVFSCRIRRVPAALTLTRGPTRSRTGTEEPRPRAVGVRRQRWTLQAPSRSASVRSQSTRIAARQPRRRGRRTGNRCRGPLVAHNRPSDPPRPQAGCRLPPAVHAAGHASPMPTFLQRFTAVLARALGLASVVVLSVASVALGPAPALGASEGPDPVGEWPLRPQPEVVAGFDPPDDPWGAGHRGVDLLGAARAGDFRRHARGPRGRRGRPR